MIRCSYTVHTFTSIRTLICVCKEGVQGMDTVGKNCKWVCEIRRYEGKEKREGATSEYIYTPLIKREKTKLGT